jgi:LysM repeat protein
MNTPNPLVPQGTFANKGKSPVPLTVFAILAIHVVLLGLLLIAGCNRKPPTDTAQDSSLLPPVPPPPTPVDTWPTSAAPARAVPPSTADIPPVPPAPPAGTDTLAPPPNPATSGLAPNQNDVPPSATGLSEHTISKGESFYTLGKKYGVGYKAIVDANPGVNPNRLKPGDKVKIPAPRPSGAMTVSATAAPTADGTKTYKVKSGDNLLKIASTFGVSVKQLRAANNLRTDQIKVGQALKIPAKTTAAEPAPPVPPVTPPQ